LICIKPPAADRFESIEFADGEGGIPLIAWCAGHLQCRKETHHYLGDHIIFIGRVLRYAYSMRQPLVFSQNQCGSLTV
jgi:flavin reductase (DIM6/NTAB) family NADH-FMN oxidoreductase RutF